MMKVKLNGTELVAREEMATIEVHEGNSYRIVIKDLLIPDLIHGKTDYELKTIVITNSAPARFKEAFKLITEISHLKIYLLTEDLDLDVDELKRFFPGSCIVFTKEFKKEV